jgi:DGQHR domain-containing protein
MAPASAPGDRIPALHIHQWLREWDAAQFNPAERRRKPEPFFYLFSLSASRLRSLSGIYRRTTAAGQLRSQDLGIQRAHEKPRSDEIHEFVRYGYPWSNLTPAQRRDPRYNDLRKPGWLPTAIVINILTEADERRGRRVDPSDLIRIEGDDRIAEVVLPHQDPSWRPKGVFPIEVIDGQHRLWAFEEGDNATEFELPVVAFHGLDISWQAYLFWTINIKPKRINASLAYDLYPLLRTEDWLERFEGPYIYRETRAQELTEALWAHPDSPWHRRINMLGETGQKQVSQAAWVRALLATYVKAWEGRRVSIGGLFGAPVGSDRQVLPWNRPQQAAFLIFVWREMERAVRSTDANWAISLRTTSADADGHDPAFAGQNTLLNTDPGIRGVLYITNDCAYLRADGLRLADWPAPSEGEATDEQAVKDGLRSLQRRPAAAFIRDLCERLATYDWRSSSAEGLSDEERIAKMAIRGSGGYKEIRRQLLLHATGANGDAGRAAADAIEALGYNS